MQANTHLNGIFQMLFVHKHTTADNDHLVRWFGGTLLNNTIHIDDDVFIHKASCYQALAR